MFCSLVDHVAVPLARSFVPQLLLVSAGYDAHREDPLAECEVTEDGFAAMTRSLHAVGEELEVPVGCVLEGGYALGALARSVAATLVALNEPVAGRARRCGRRRAARRATRSSGSRSGGRRWPESAVGDRSLATRYSSRRMDPRL